MTYEYCTLADVEAELRATNVFSSVTNPSSAVVTEWIRQESAYINELANRVFSSTSVTEVYDYEGGDYLLLEQSPVMSITSLKYNSSVIGSSSYSSSWVTKVEDSDFTLYDKKGLVYFVPSQFSPLPGVKKFEVEYVYGYTSTPLVIKMLCTKLVTQRVMESLLNDNLNSRNDGGSVSVGNVRIVEPNNYGLGNFQRLAISIETLKQEVITTYQVFRTAW
jgi:hypothetical protein